MQKKKRKKKEEEANIAKIRQLLQAQRIKVLTTCSSLIGGLEETHLTKPGCLLFDVQIELSFGLPC